MLSFYRTNWLHNFWTSLIFFPLLSHQTFFCQLIPTVLGLRRACLRFTLFLFSKLRCVRGKARSLPYNPPGLNSFWTLLPLNLSQSAVSSSIPFENLPYGSLLQEGKPIKPKYLITTILSKRLSGNCGFLDGRNSDRR